MAGRLRGRTVVVTGAGSGLGHAAALAFAAEGADLVLADVRGAEDVAKETGGVGTRQIAVDYGREGIRANPLCPGTVWTPLVERTYTERGGDATFGSPEAMRERAARSYPLGRLGTPAEVAAFALFLLSDESSWISGGVFAADGGFTAR